MYAILNAEHLLTNTSGIQTQPRGGNFGLEVADPSGRHRGGSALRFDYDGNYRGGSY